MGGNTTCGKICRRNVIVTIAISVTISVTITTTAAFGPLA
jgi:hypothetical protein